MLGNPEVAPLEQGYAIIEDYFSAGYDAIRSQVSEIVEPYIEGLSKEDDPAFDVFAQNIIRGIDRAKAFRKRPLEVARRTFAVSKLVMCVALDHEPSFEIIGAIEEHINLEQPTDDNFISMCQNLAQSFRTSRGFGTIMTECQPSIDPQTDEPDVFPIIAGFALQSAALAEAKRVRQELDKAANNLSEFDGDLWALFEQ